ncbi:unnamed protein product [Durusdinium trenchii]|uniref:Cilia- and flagella-associated protein 157 n=1 Tax=Durusdinium trenchii TaxID=1381693 RepID=A0ABP0PBT5_9DINO
MQAFQKVMALEQDEAGLKQQLWAEHQRVDRLEEALQREEKQRDEVMKENLELKKEMQHEAQVNDQTAQRLDALEKGHSAGAETRVQALEEENVKFRAALAGAARRLINLEADVTSQRRWDDAQRLGGVQGRAPKLCDTRSSRCSQRAKSKRSRIDGKGSGRL